jgi:hypothetical protein
MRARADIPDMHVRRSFCFASLPYVGALLSILLLTTDAAPQVRIPDWFKKVPAAALSERDAGQGVKEALAQGVTKAVLNLHRTDGFFGNELYKLLLPPDAKKADTALRRIGLAGQMDKGVLAMNRSAE